MIFVYPYKRKDSDFLINHSIRLVKLAYPNAMIITIGDKVEGIKNIPVADKSDIRGVNVTNKLLSLDYNEFIYMNDDFMINNHFDFNKHHKHADVLTNRTASIEWNESVNNTKEWLTFNGFTIDCYENHQPLLINRYRLHRLFNQIEWRTTPHFIKSLYCNVYHKAVEIIPNLKLAEFTKERADKLFNDYGCLSTSNGFDTAQGLTYIKTLRELES